MADIGETARDLLTVDAWQTLDTLRVKLADRVPADKSVATYERLLRAKSVKPTSSREEQQRIGRERVIQEVFQHLVGRGLVEACGRGESRQYRLREEPLIMFIKRPKSRKEWIPLEQLVFDARLQYRSLAEGKLFDEATVERYRESLTNGASFPPLVVVQEASPKKTTNWVIGGFNRGEMYRRENRNSVEVVVYPGTFLDARMWALSENGDQPLPRTPADCRRAFDTLIDSPELITRVLDTVKESGGVQRSIAAACGISTSAVGNYLKDRGLQADRKTGKLVPIPKPAVEESLPEEPAPAPPARASKPEPTIKATPTTQPMPAAAQVTEPEPQVIAKDALSQITKDLRSLSRNVNTLMMTKYLPQLRVLAKAKNLPFEIEDREIPGGVSGADKTERFEMWPVIRDLGHLFSELSAQVYAG